MTAEPKSPIKKPFRVKLLGESFRIWELLYPLPFLGGALVILAIHLFVFPIKLNPGQVVPYNIVSPSDAIYTNSEELEKLTRGGKTFIIDPAVESAVLQKLHQFFNEVRMSRVHRINETDELASLARKYQVPEETVGLLLTFDETSLSETEAYASDLLSALMKSVIDQERLDILRRTSRESVSATTPEVIAYSMADVNIKEAAEPADIRRYIEKLVSRPIKKGEIILGEGGVVTREVLDKLHAVEKGLAKQKLYTYYGLFLLLLALSIIWIFHALRYRRGIIGNPALWIQITVLLLLALCVSLVVGRLPFPYVYYALPVGIASAAIVVTTVYDAVLGLYLAIGLSAIVALSFNLNANLGTYIFLSSIYPVVFLGRRSEARNLVYFGVNFGFFCVLLSLMVILVSVQTFSWWAIAYAFLTGVGACILALGVIPILELMTTQPTPGKLSQLLNPEQPLLKRLILEAPGTYFHSYVMSSMADEACGRIGANALLAKVGAMYHDIGKLKRPGFFVENISDPNENPHKSLPPESSYQIVVNHVIEGIELARKARLPKEVIAFIPEHHGRGIVKYFYEEALKRKGEEGKAEVSAEDFRYPGPNPQSRETAVVMLADSCEAVVRAMGSFTEADVRETVKKLIDEKLSDGLLDDSGLTAGDINQIIDSFTSVLVNLHHARIRYSESASEKT